MLSRTQLTISCCRFMFTIKKWPLGLVWTHCVKEKLMSQGCKVVIFTALFLRCRLLLGGIGDDIGLNFKAEPISRTFQLSKYCHFILTSRIIIIGYIGLVTYN